MPWREDNQVLIRQSAVYLMHLLCRHKSGVFENSGFRRDCSKVISVDFMKRSKTERWLLTLLTVSHIIWVIFVLMILYKLIQRSKEIRSAKDWFDIQWVWFEILQCHLFHKSSKAKENSRQWKNALKWTGPNFERKKRTMKTFKIISHLSIIRMIY